MEEIDAILSAVLEALEEAYKEANKKYNISEKECDSVKESVSEKVVEKPKNESPIYDKLTDKVFCIGDNKFKLINNDGSITNLNFGAEGATITDNQLLVALLYRYRNDVRKYNYVKELLV